MTGRVLLDLMLGFFYGLVVLLLRILRAYCDPDRDRLVFSSFKGITSVMFKDVNMEVNEYSFFAFICADKSDFRMTYEIILRTGTERRNKDLIYKLLPRPQEIGFC